MGEIVNINTANIEPEQQEPDLSIITSEMLAEVNDDICEKKSLSVPIAEISKLGLGVSSLIPLFSSLPQTETLYRVVNAAPNSVLKQAKDGAFWGAMKNADGTSTMAKLATVDNASTAATAAVDSAAIFMAVALFSIERELGNIAEMEKQILSFLEIEKEAEIEADVVTLSDIISKYKHNWNNELYIASNHKMVCDIQRTARKNMIAAQKNVTEVLKTKKLFVLGTKVDSTFKSMLRRFGYYRLSLYTFSLASLAEIMLSKNFSEDTIHGAITEIDSKSVEYRELFSECSGYIEGLSNKSVEMNLLKGLGTASDAVGKIISNVPKIKDQRIDEMLIETGEKAQRNAKDINKDILNSFSKVSDPNTRSLISILKDLDQIYNRTTEVCLDNNNLYLVAV